MKWLLFFVFAFGFTPENFAQQQATLPQAKSSLHTNRLRISELQPGGINWRRLPNGIVDFNQIPISVDFDGTPKASAGIEFSGLWLGGIDTAGQLRVSCSDAYNSHEFPFVAGPLSGDWSTDSINAIQWDRFFQVDRISLEKHRADWADNGILDNPLPSIVGWPGRGNPNFELQYGFTLPDGELAPFVDMNGDGIYNAFDGDYPHPPSLDPDILPGEIIWNIFNDAYGRFTDKPLGVEVQSTAWALTCENNDLLNETVFFSYRVVNRSGFYLDSVVAGIWLNPNLGASQNDHWGTHASSNSIFIYNEDNIDELQYLYLNSFGENPPVVTFTSLNQPLYKTMYHVTGVACDAFHLYGPVTKPDYYRFLNGVWNNGVPLSYGGSGPGMGLPTDFAFPGDPNDPGSWSMLNIYWTCITKFALSSFYIGTLSNDSSFTLEFAFSYHRGADLNHLQNVTYCFNRLDQLHQLYDVKFSSSCILPELCTDDCVWPGDFDRNGIVRLCDLLPLGVGWGTVGPERPGLVTWSPHTATNWNILYNNTYDLKHLDANGDGTLNLSDVNVNQTFYGLTVPDYSPAPDTYKVGDGLWMKHSYSPTNPDNVYANDLIVIKTYVGSVASLYGVAFEMEYDTNYWKFVSLVNASSAPLKVAKQNGGAIECARVFTDQSSEFAPNQILLHTNLRAKAIPDSLSDTTLIRIKNIRGIRADGSEIPMSANFLRYCFGGGCPAYIGTYEVQSESVHVYPNPSSGRLTLVAPDMTWEYIEAFDMAGRLLRRWEGPGTEQTELDLSGMAPGWILLRLGSGEWIGQQRVLLMR
ncbi:MAG: T9SS C-terminal target domain-containing protein [Haliscomenobacteraceae bacterium CHB4]|nr:T9SS C-terminal target domain-containing protein [Haliscomenobacteraceae bacterium CHB4]